MHKFTLGGKNMYCMYCGKEVSENAYVCVSCGALVKKPPQQEEEQLTKDSAPIAPIRSGKALKVFMGLAFIFLFLSVLMFVMAGSPAMYVDYAERIYDACDLLIGALINAFFTFMLSVPTFIFGLKEKESFNLKWTSVCLFIVSVILLAFGIIMMCNY